MSDPSYFEDLVSTISEQTTKFIDDLVDGANRIADMLDDASSGVSGFFDDILPGDAVDKAIEKWNNEIQPAIQEGVDKVRTEVQQAVDQLAGNPMDLIDYSNAYADAKTKLYRAQTLDQLLLSLSNAWEGQAYDAYALVAGEQNTALHDLTTALENGATQTNAAAQKILTLWKDLAHQYLGFGADILDILASATNASNVISFEVPTILQAISKVWNKILDIADILVEFMIGQATEDSLSWRMLNNGSDGLPQNQWPVVLESTSDAINDPHNWEAQPA